ncbi:MAG: hypothetical protein HS108_10590 [Planctomycetes bacterium]|jgi:hypothetical protein|nr:hypothetical protein [Planctomycetota bacterium]MCL4731678.1 hypothetical protein [Planctomycetota bacterium]
MMDTSESRTWMAGLIRDPGGPLFCLRARLTLDDEELFDLALRELPPARAGLAPEQRQMLELYARSFVRRGGGVALSDSELRQVLASRESLLCFGQAVESVLAKQPVAPARENPSGTSGRQPADPAPDDSNPEIWPTAAAPAVQRLPWYAAGLLGAASAAAILFTLWLVVSDQGGTTASNEPPAGIADSPQANRPPVEILRVGEFDLTVEHGHGMFSAVLWRGAQEPGLRANPLFEFYNAGWGGLFALHITNPPYREAAQAETRLVEFEQTGNRVRLVYENAAYGRKVIILTAADNVLRAQCELAGTRQPVWTSQCGMPLFFRRVYLLTPGRERNFNLTYSGGHRNFIDEEGNPQDHTDVLLTNEPGSYAWLCRVEPSARPLLLSTASGLNGPNWQLQPGDTLTVMIGSEADLRRLRVR